MKTSDEGRRDEDDNKDMVKKLPLLNLLTFRNIIMPRPSVSNHRPSSRLAAAIESRGILAPSQCSWKEDELLETRVVYCCLVPSRVAPTDARTERHNVISS